MPCPDDTIIADLRAGLPAEAVVWWLWPADTFEEARAAITHHLRGLGMAEIPVAPPGRTERTGPGVEQVLFRHADPAVMRARRSSAARAVAALPKRTCPFRRSDDIPLIRNESPDCAMPPASRLTDPHACPAIPAGPVAGPCVPTVLTGSLPQAVVGDMCACIGPPDPIVRGSRSVFVGGRPAARMGDATGKGGALVFGWPTVLIGDKSNGGGGAGAFSNAPCLKKAAAAGAAFVKP